MPRELMGMSGGVVTTGLRSSSLHRLAARRAEGGGAEPPAAFAGSLTAMSANKLPGPEGPAKLGPLVTRPPLLRAEHGTPVLVQEKLLAEIAHELGNFFHKLYYWSDYLKQKPAPKSADSTAAQMLERTIKNLEDFLRVSLDYFHPTQLSFTRMAVRDLLEGLLFQVRAQLNGTPLTLSDDDGWRREDAEVLIDPGHLSRAFEVAVRRLTTHVGPESSVPVAIERSARRDRAGLEVGFQLHQPNEA